MKDARILLEWALERIAEVKQYTAGGRGEFAADRKTQAAVLRNLQTMAESTQRLPDYPTPSRRGTPRLTGAG
ncbi:MAG TPA: HepT-like ribonuclease domain-containing protein [Deinococcales bacterium]|nr:HepT-like ribonuclease domain-containing protein [Deinococcales bacterium]